MRDNKERERSKLQHSMMISDWTYINRRTHGRKVGRPKEGTDSARGFALTIGNLELRRSRILAIVGTSGSGKTTLFDVLTGVAPSSLQEQVRASFPNIGYLMHDSALIPWRTVRENFGIEARLRRKKIDFSYFLSLLRELHLDDKYADWKCSSLSFGMLQRVELALALSAEVDLLVMDEGLSGLSYDAKLAACRLIRRETEQRDMSCVFTSHFPSDVLRLADVLVPIKEGSIKSEIPIRTPAVKRLGLSDGELLTHPECSAILDGIYRGLTSVT